MDSLKLNESVSCNVIRNRPIMEALLLGGRWKMEHWRRRKSGNLYLREEQDFANLINTTAKTLILNTMFRAATQIAAASWFAGLVNNSGFTAFAAGDTMSSHSGWTEWTNITQATRPLWGQGDAVSASITNASAIQFDINATGTIKGIFITSNNTIGGTSGTLWTGSAFTSNVDVVNGDQIRSTYTLSC